MNEDNWELLRCFVLYLVLPFKVALSFYGIFRNWEKQFKNTRSKFFIIISFVLPQSFCFIFSVHFRLFCLTFFTQMLSSNISNRWEKVTCESRGTQTTKPDIARHKKSCSAGTLYCTQCPNFSTISQNDLNYHIAMKHSAPKPDVAFKCKLCYQDFPGFYALRQHRNTQHGKENGSALRDVDVEHVEGVVEDHKLREKFCSCQHFLMDSELEKVRHKLFNCAIENLNAEIVDEGLNHIFNNLKCEAKVNLASGFILRILEDGRFRYFYAHENNTLLDRSKLVCTRDDLAKLKDFFESCSR